ncbi:MAG: Sporulation integral membrane protein YlbJ [Firmicutes bacterium ADurb.Bin193]|nr:MAG: Sporulation integral membrane protein YlbJ [Firmicutes bacterium ADurb.Bin193]
MKLLAGFALFVFIGLVTAPSRCLAGAERGLMLCAKIIIPSLFPFFICSKLLIETGTAQRIGRWFSPIMRPLFNVPGIGGIAFVLGLLSGYPVGAQTGVDMYEKNLCTKAEAQRIICFCNNSGPLFIIGSVGAGMLFSGRAGLLLYLIHILSAISVGLVFRFYKYSERMTLPCAAYHAQKATRKSIGEIFSHSVAKSAELIVYVCGFIVFFSTFIVILEHFKITGFLSDALALTGISQNVSKAAVLGFLEIANGTVRFASLPIGDFRVVFISMVIAWSGVSVILQVSGIIAKSGLSSRVFVAAKALQAVFAGVYAMLLTRLPLGSATVFAKDDISVFEAWRFSFSMLCVAVGVYLAFFLARFVLSNVKLK